MASRDLRLRGKEAVFPAADLSRLGDRPKFFILCQIPLEVFDDDVTAVVANEVEEFLETNGSESEKQESLYGTSSSVGDLA